MIPIWRQLLSCAVVSSLKVCNRCYSNTKTPHNSLTPSMHLDREKETAQNTIHLLDIWTIKHRPTWEKQPWQHDSDTQLWFTESRAWERGAFLFRWWCVCVCVSVCVGSAVFLFMCFNRIRFYRFSWQSPPPKLLIRLWCDKFTGLKMALRPLNECEK